ncbi:MAG: group 1 truncated hemoglobin [Cyclobacteriaceae bacterium]
MEKVQITTKTTTLYERLGGEAKVRKIVNDALDKNYNNPIIGHHFKKVDMKKLKQLVFEFFSMGTGGPHKYTGRDMPTSHASLNITEDDFQKSNIDVTLALQENGVGESEINEVISILDSMKRDVIRA